MQAIDQVNLSKIFRVGRH